MNVQIVGVAKQKGVNDENHNDGEPPLPNDEVASGFVFVSLECGDFLMPSFVQFNAFGDGLANTGVSLFGKIPRHGAVGVPLDVGCTHGHKQAVWAFPKSIFSLSGAVEDRG